MAKSVQAIKSILSDKLQTDLSFGPKWACFENAREAGFEIRVGGHTRTLSEDHWQVEIAHRDYLVSAKGQAPLFVDAVSEAFRQVFEQLDDWEMEQHRAELDQLA